MVKSLLKLPKIGLALGSGAARGAAHIGIIRGLNDLGIEPNCIAGTSVGGMIAGAYIADKLNEVEKWLHNLNKRREIIKFFDFSFRDGGLIKGERAINALLDMSIDMNIEDGHIPIGLVATDMHSGREVWLKEGNLLQAIKASSAIPGLVSPFCIDDRWLIDGAIVNPVPVSLCKALGAELIIAVNLNTTMTSKRLADPHQKKTLTSGGPLNQLMSKWRHTNQKSYKPQYFDVLEASLDIMQEQITKSRMAGEPPDITLCPRLTDFGMFQFDRSKEAQEEGYRCVMRNKESLLSLLHYNLSHQKTVKRRLKAEEVS